MNEAAMRGALACGLSVLTLFACSPEEAPRVEGGPSGAASSGSGELGQTVLRLVPTLSDPAVERRWTPPEPADSRLAPVLEERFEQPLDARWKRFDDDRSPVRDGVGGLTTSEGSLLLVPPVFAVRCVAVEPGGFYELRARVRVVGDAAEDAPPRAVSALAQPLKNAIDWAQGPELTLRQQARAHASRMPIAFPLLPDPEKAGRWHEVATRLQAPFDAAAMLLTFMTLAGAGQQLEVDAVRFAPIPLRQALGLEAGAAEPEGLAAGAGGLFEGFDGVPRALARQAEVDHERRAALVLPPPASVSFLIDVPEGELRFEFARALLDPRPRGVAGAPVALRVEVERDGRTTTIHEEAIGAGDPTSWEDRAVDFSRSAGEVVRLHLHATGASEHTLLIGAPLIRRVAARDPRPNVVVVSLDTLRADRLGVAGYGRDTTPRIDALARELVWFRDATSASSYTLPAHATLLTGQLPRVHGVRSPGFGPTRLSERRSDPLARRLADAGWLTTAFTGGVYVGSEFGFATGFDRFDYLDCMLSEDDERWFLHPRRRQHADNLAHRRRRGLDHVLRWVDDHRDGRFLLFLHTYLVHNYRPSPAYRERFYVDRGSALGGSLVWPRRRSPEGESVSELDRLHYEDLYDATVCEADALVGRLVDHLRDAGLWENTLFVLTSDHGEEFAEHGEMGHGHSLYQELVDVPLLIHAPGVAPRVVDEPVSLADVLPTLLEALGLEARRPMQGRSLWPLLRGEDLPPRDVHFEVVRAGQPPLAGLRAGPWKLLARYGEDAPAAAPVGHWLYQLEEDRLELDDATARQPALSADLVQRLAESREALAALGRALGSGEAAGAIPDAMREQLERLGYLPPGDPDEADSAASADDR